MTTKKGRPFGNKFVPYWTVPKEPEEDQSYLFPVQTNLDQFPKKPKKYSQNWHSYDQAQTNEAVVFHEMAYSLLYSLFKEQPKVIGRPKLELPERILLMLLRVYFGKSTRRLIGFLAYSRSKGYLSKQHSYSSICRFFREPEVTAQLMNVLIETSKPLREYETSFAVDASGFGTSLYAHYFGADYRKFNRRKGFLKANVMIGVSTHIITAAVISEKFKHEVRDMPYLVDTTAQTFRLSEVSADPAYLADYNLQGIVKHGGKPFILLKSNTDLFPQKHWEKSVVWMETIRSFHYNKAKFMERYHLRSNIETAFSMIKKKLNPNVKSKDTIAQRNEVLCNLICHNLLVLISEIFENDLSIDWFSERAILSCAINREIWHKADGCGFVS